VAIARLVDEERLHASGRRAIRSARESPAMVHRALVTIRANRLLRALVAAELLWGFGMIAFETLFAPRMADVAGGADRAAQILGPTLTVSWIASAVGSAVLPRIADRFGAPATAFTLRLLHGIAVAGMAWALGPAGLVAAYLANYFVHGATNTVHYGMVHSAVDSVERVTVVSANSLAAQLGGAIGGIALGALADMASVSVAMVVGAVVLACAAPLYLARDAGRPAVEVIAGVAGEAT
jgi:predicted MFS family arabinose efflux permease